MSFTNRILLGLAAGVVVGLAVGTRRGFADCGEKSPVRSSAS
jgi:hypothetical protein